MWVHAILKVMLNNDCTTERTGLGFYLQSRGNPAKLEKQAGKVAVIVQWLWHWTMTPTVRGSNPGRGRIEVNLPHATKLVDPVWALNCDWAVSTAAPAQGC